MILAVAAILVAGAGAFASSNSHKANTYFYRPTPTTCASVQIDKTCQPTNTGCLDFVPGFATPQQLFDDSNCLTPLAEI